MNVYFKQYLYESKNLEFKDFFLTYIIGNNQSLKLNFSVFIPKITIKLQNYNNLLN